MPQSKLQCTQASCIYYSVSYGQLPSVYDYPNPHEHSILMNKLQYLLKKITDIRLVFIAGS